MRAGIGKTLISRAAVKRDLKQGWLVEERCEQTPIHRRMLLIHHGSERLPPAAARLRQRMLGWGKVG